MPAFNQASARRGVPHVAVVAGAGPGLGRSLSLALHRVGYRVVALTRQLEQAALRDVLPDSVAQILPCELTDAKSVACAFDAVEAEVGAPNLLIYNAGHLVVRPFTELTETEMNECWKVNYHGAFLCAQRALPTMLASGGGTIAFTGAQTSLRGEPKMAACVASKFALRGLAECLANEYAGHGVRVHHVVVDGWIFSPKIQRRFGLTAEQCLREDDIADAYVRLLLEDASTAPRELVLRGPTQEGP